MDPKLVRFSKFLSLILRHNPGKIGLALDDNGWADVDELLAKANDRGVPLTHPLLLQVVATNDKQRFKLSDDGRRIRASQGHSIPVDLQLQPVAPPQYLYHGTATRFLDAIRKEGLLPRNRQHVHLSPDVEAALKVGRRHGRPVVLTIHAAEMNTAGHAFYLSDNHVWLVKQVPPAYIDFDAGANSDA
jgi:putative RNA 2'-phosphotransferase